MRRTNTALVQRSTHRRARRLVRAARAAGLQSTCVCGWTPCGRDTSSPGPAGCWPPGPCALRLLLCLRSCHRDASLGVPRGGACTLRPPGVPERRAGQWGRTGPRHTDLVLPRRSSQRPPQASGALGAALWTSASVTEGVSGWRAGCGSSASAGSGLGSCGTSQNGAGQTGVSASALRPGCPSQAVQGLTR